MRFPLDFPPGLVADDTTYAARGRWADGSNVRFRLGRPQVIGGWESLTTTLLTGVCRNIFPWTDNAGVLNVAFGTHSNVAVWQDTLYDITPTLALPPLLLGANPLTTQGAASPNVTFTWNGHPLTTSDTINVSGATAVGGITPNGGPFNVVAVTTNTVTFAFTSNASSGASGGGSAVVITPNRAFAAGAIDGTGGQGYGTGAYGVGGYSQPSTSDYFPRTAGMDAWGQNLIYNPRAGTIYAWTNNTGTPLQPLQNAPWKVTHALVAPNDGGYQLFALGCNQEADGVFNPKCIRHSSVRNNTEWNTSESTTAREYVLATSGQIVAGRMLGDFLAVWTDDDLWIAEFVGNLDQPWAFSQVGEHCGLIGPNAVVVVGQTAYWISPDRQVHSYALGTTVQVVECPIRDDFALNLAASQGSKVAASANAEFSEVRFDYPDQRDGTGYENSRYLTLCLAGEEAGQWYKGQMARTAYTDAGPAQYPLAATYAGNVYYHERGNSADGGAFSWFIETADLYLDENTVMQVKGLWPDFIEQQGPITAQMFARFYLQADLTSSPAIAMGLGQGKADFRLTGRLFRLKLSGNSAPTAARIGKLEIEAEATGLR